MKKLIKITVWTLAFTVTLVVLFYAEENWRGARAWRKTTAELQAQGYPLTLSEIIPPPIADDDNIAAAPVFAELFTADGEENLDARLRQAKRIETTSKMLPNLLQGELGDLRFYYEPNPKFSMTEREAAQKILAELDREWTPLLAEVRDALQRTRCRWPLAYERGYGMPVPSCLNAAKMLELRAQCHLALGQTAQAADDVILIYQLAQTSEAVPGAIGVLLAITEQSLAAQTVWLGCAKNFWSAQDLARLQKVIPLGKNFPLTQAAHQYEQALYFTEFPKIYRFNFSNCPVSGWKNKMIWVSLGLRPRGWNELDKIKYAELMDSEVSSADFMGVEQFEVSKAAREAKVRHSIMLSIVLTPAIHQKVARAEVLNGQAILACALERYRLSHGKLPLTLGELAPEFIEKVPNQVTVSDPMIYRRVNDSDYVLYSIGWNLRDDGGAISDNQRADQLDWVWASKPELYQHKKVEK